MFRYGIRYGIRYGGFGKFAAIRGSAAHSRLFALGSLAG